MTTYTETIHENKKRSKCECGKQFASKKGLQRHKNSVHAEVKIFFQCHICGLKLSRKDKLKTHQNKHFVKDNTRNNVEENLETVHERKKCFACECGKKNSDKRALQHLENSRHAEVKKTVKCEFCDLTLSRKDKLKTHQDKFCKRKK